MHHEDTAAVAMEPRMMSQAEQHVAHLREAARHHEHAAEHHAQAAAAHYELAVHHRTEHRKHLERKIAELQ